MVGTLTSTINLYEERPGAELPAEDEQGMRG